MTEIAGFDEVLREDGSGDGRPMTKPGDGPGAHQERMAALQAEMRKKRATARDPGRGLVLVHTGDGKGKSSSAFGVIAADARLGSAGRGRAVHQGQLENR